MVEIPITNLRAEKAKNGKIYVLISDGRLSGYALCVACLDPKVFAEWVNEEDVRKKAMFHG